MAWRLRCCDEFPVTGSSCIPLHREFATCSMFHGAYASARSVVSSVSNCCACCCLLCCACFACSQPHVRVLGLCVRVLCCTGQYTGLRPCLLPSLRIHPRWLAMRCAWHEAHIRTEFLGQPRLYATWSPRLQSRPYDDIATAAAVVPAAAVLDKGGCTDAVRPALSPYPVSASPNEITPSGGYPMGLRFLPALLLMFR